MTEYIGKEILLVMKENEISSEISKLLTDAGFIVTVNSNQEQILDLLNNKFFVAACFDLDTPQQSSGILFLKKALELSPLTHNFLLSSRQDFNALLAVYRLGGKDFILLKDNYQNYLLKKITQSATSLTYKDRQNILMKSMLKIHADFFKRMVSLHIKYTECQRALLQTEEDESNNYNSVSVLVVDDSKTLYDRLLAESSIRGWNLVHLDLGGSALEHGASENYDIALIKYSLPDLPGSMVASALKSYNSGIFILMYSLSDDKVTLHSDSVVSSLPESVETVERLIEGIIKQADIISENRLKKQHLQAFKAQNYNFLKQYNEIRNKALEVLELEREMKKIQ